IRVSCQTLSAQWFSRRASEKGGAVEHGWFERLTEVMGAMAQGDTTALGALYEEFGDPIRGAVRKELGRLGVTHLEAAEIDGLAVDVCAELFRLSRSWVPARGVGPLTRAMLSVPHTVAATVG